MGSSKSNKRGRYKKKHPRGLKHWNEEEIRYLQKYWGEHTRRTMTERLQRSWYGICRKALNLGIYGRRDQGLLNMHEAAKKYGFDHTTIISVLRQMKVVIVKKHGERAKSKPQWAVMQVDEEAADRAIRLYLARETLNERIEKLGYSTSIRKAFVRFIRQEFTVYAQQFGERKSYIGCLLRLPSKKWDVLCAAFVAYRKRMEGNRHNTRMLALPSGHGPATEDRRAA